MNELKMETILPVSDLGPSRFQSLETTSAEVTAWITAPHSGRIHHAAAIFLWAKGLIIGLAMLAVALIIRHAQHSNREGDM
jgi:hypothetical protein